MGALLAFIPLKDWIYGAIIVALLAGSTTAWVHHDHVEQLKGQEVLLAATRAAEAKRVADLAAQAKIDQANLQKVSDDYQIQLDASQRNNALLAQRLQDYYASRRGTPVSPAPSPSGGADAAPGEPSSVESAVGFVVEAAGHDAAQVIALQNYIRTECVK